MYKDSSATVFYRSTLDMMKGYRTFIIAGTILATVVIFLAGDLLTYRNSFVKYYLLRKSGKLPSHLYCGRASAPGDEWSTPILPNHLRNVSQGNPDLAAHICRNWIVPPFTGERNLSHPEKEHYSQRGQSEFIDDLLAQRRNGFFVECGAGDGEALSNSLFFEKSRNWTGLLIEGNPLNFDSTLKKRRHAYMLNACLSPSTKPIVASFKLANLIGGIDDYMEKTHKDRIQRSFGNATTIRVQCFPLYAVLRAIGVSHIDYFSLDIEGAELEILYTIPLELITIDVLSIEYIVSNNKEASKAKLEAITKYLVVVHGYKIVRVGHGEDVILMK